jgi:site-specific recombinase XerD
MLAEIERFVNWTRRRSPAARTWKDYGYDLHFFMEIVGDRSLKDITFKDIDHFVGVQSEKGFKPATINRRLASVVSLYAFLVVEDEIGMSSYCTQASCARQQRLPRPPEEDLKRFFAVITETRSRRSCLLRVDCASVGRWLQPQTCSWTKNIHASLQEAKARENEVCISRSKQKLLCGNIWQNADQ